MDSQLCDVNAVQLIAYLCDQTTDPGFQAHVAQCRTCQLKLLQMSAAAMTTGNDRKTCAAYEAQLPEFVGTEQMRDAKRFAALQTHLVLCEKCFALYQELHMSEQFVANDILPTPPRSAYREPDLSFLQPPFEWVKTQVIGTELVQTLRLQLSMLFVQTNLRPGPARGDELGTPSSLSPDSDSLSEEFIVGAETLGELDIEVKLCPEADDNRRARLEVRALSIKRIEVGFGGTRVTLHLPDKPAVEQLTNEDGVTIFPELPRDELPLAILEITPAM